MSLVRNSNNAKILIFLRPSINILGAVSQASVVVIMTKLWARCSRYIGSIPDMSN